MRFHDGMEVIFDSGELLTPGIVESTRPSNKVLGELNAVLVRFNPSACSWVEPENLRPMRLDDHRRIHAKPFHAWLRMVWYTLIFRYGLDFRMVAIRRDELYAYWSDGWSESATIKRREREHGWRRFPPPAPPSPAYDVLADLGDEDGLEQAGGSD
jgi:hypothetical protein